MTQRHKLSNNKCSIMSCNAIIQKKKNTLVNNLLNYMHKCILIVYFFLDILVSSHSLHVFDKAFFF